MVKTVLCWGTGPQRAEIPPKPESFGESRIDDDDLVVDLSSEEAVCLGRRKLLSVDIKSGRRLFVIQINP